MNGPLPCCYCGNPPTLLRKDNPRDEMDRRMAVYVCRAVGCQGQPSYAPKCSTGYLRQWNARQKQYGRVIDRARATVIPLIAGLGHPQ